MLFCCTLTSIDRTSTLCTDYAKIEFPSVLLPDNITSGSIVDIDVSRNLDAEAKSIAAFQTLQKRILNTYGLHSPSPPVLRLRNATQTSLVLEWDPINLATASLKSLSLYRNNSKAGSIPRPLEMLSTKISGLAIHTEYTFHLVLKTSAGTYQSEKLVCRTHKMTDLSGITVTPGIMPPPQKEALARAVDRIGGRLIDTVRIDTTHFVCTEGRGPLWEKAVEMNIPVVRPEWVDACEAEGTIVSVRGYYLNADPKHRQLGNRSLSQSQSQQSGQQQQQQATSPTPSGPAESQTNLPVRAAAAGDEPPTTPFPGGENHLDHAGDSQSRVEETEVENSPPPPPPKDDATEEKEEEDDDDEDKEESGNGEDGEKEEDEDDEEETEEISEKKLSGSDGIKSNGGAGEGELDEVPL